MSLRLVPDQGFEKVGKWLTRAVEQLAPAYADVEVKLLHGGDPVRCDVSHPAFHVSTNGGEAPRWSRQGDELFYIDAENYLQAVRVATRPAFGILDEAFESVVGRGTVPVRAGGSIPVVPELQRGGAPVLLTGIGLPDDGLHSPNEKVALQQIWDGIEVFSNFFRGFAEKGVAKSK